MRRDDDGQPKQLVLSVDEWPVAHRALWQVGTVPKGGRLAKRKHADRLEPVSIRNARRGYGAFLVIVQAEGIDTNVRRPRDLVTPENVALFVDRLFDRGNKANSVKQRLFNLRTALRIMEPDVEFGWITRPGGASINEFLRQEFEAKELPAPRELTQLGLDLITRAQTANPLSDAAKRSARNGLMCALLAIFPIRLRSLALMRLGQHVSDLGTSIELAFSDADMKNRRRLECSVPDHLVPAFRFYLDTVRPAMSYSDEGWFWLNVDGTRFEYAGIQGMFRRLSTRELGRTLGTHSTRHGLATALADVAPQRPGLAATILGVSEDVVSIHYRRAEMRHAARLANTLLNEERSASRLRARMLFGRRSV